ncbi:DNA repair protein Rad60 isoform X2 [Eurosta solidaginis]|uniref:DNA repair protein Rad60 isoform X2 n=1 Tax=Eurosta solidaginis TaxID=178769 RepID=UPI0035307C4B
MSQEYDVFAELYENDKDEKAKFLETLKSRDAAVNGTASSDDDELLPGSLRGKGRGRGKKAKPAPASKKKDVSPQQDINGSKTRKLETPGTENAHAPLSETAPLSLPTEETGPTRRRRSTRNSTASSSLNAVTTTITAPTNVTPAGRGGRGGRGRKGRRGRNTAAPMQGLQFGLPSVANTISIAETMDIFAAMMGGRVRRNVMRARRDYFAEVAARATNVDYVDLVSSPMPRIEGVVTVDSDADDSKSSNSVEITGAEQPSTSFTNTLESSFDEDNPEISVKIKWEGGNPEIFKLRKYQKFHKIFNEIAERENTQIDNLVFNIENRIIAASDTPASINYKIYEFISGRVLTDMFQVGAERKKRDANVISLKIQSDLWPKKPLKVELNKTDKLKILYIKCAEELKMPTEDLILSFNGDHLGFNDTPEDFELENDEAVDLRLKKK